MILRLRFGQFLKLELNIVDFVGGKYSVVFKSLSPRSKNVGGWCSTREGVLALKAVVWIFDFSPGDLQPS